LQLADRPKAEERLDGWLEEVCDFVKHFRATYEKQYRGGWGDPFGNVVTTVDFWRSMILNYIDCKHGFERGVTNAFAEYANKEIKKAHLRGNGYTYEVLRIKLLHGGLLAKRRPPHPLDETPKVAERGRQRRRGGKDQAINPRANVARLERVREERDATRNLIAKPQEDPGWLARFGDREQPDLSFDQGPWEPAKRRGKRRGKDKVEQPGSVRRPPRVRGRNRDQMKMF
jgi:hypothetical protein